MQYHIEDLVEIYWNTVYSNDYLDIITIRHKDSRCEKEFIPLIILAANKKTHIWRLCMYSSPTVNKLYNNMAHNKDV